MFDELPAGYRFEALDVSSPIGGKSRVTLQDEFGRVEAERERTDQRTRPNRGGSVGVFGPKVSEPNSQKHLETRRDNKPNSPVEKRKG